MYKDVEYYKKLAAEHGVELTNDDFFVDDNGEVSLNGTDPEELIHAMFGE